MKVVDRLTRRITRLLTTPGQELGRWARILRSQIQLWRFCARRLHANNATAMSAALSFRTIFAMVPAMVLGFLMLKTLGMVEDRKRVLHDFLREGGLTQIAYVQAATTQPAAEGTPPDDGARDAVDRDSGQGDAPAPITLAETIESLVSRVEAQLTLRRLGPIGVVMMIWTALTLLTTIERCLNRVFEAPRSRSVPRRTLLYWSVVTLGPLVLIAAGYLSDGLMSAARGVPGLSWLLTSVGWIGPILVGVVLLATLYRLMPNTPVALRSAMLGASVAVPVWLVARWAFALYVAHVGSKSVYGAIGLMPLFLMWVNVSWLIFLFGAEVAHTAANLVRMQSAEESKRRLVGSWDLLAAAVTIARENLATGAPVAIERISEALDLPDVATEDLLGRLVDAGMVCPVAAESDPAYLLAKPAGSISVTAVLRIGRTTGDVGQPHPSADTAHFIERLRRLTEADIEDATLERIAADPEP